MKRNYAVRLVGFALIGIVLGLILSAIPVSSTEFGWPNTVWRSVVDFGTFWRTKGTWSLEGHWDYLRFDTGWQFISAIELQGLVFNVCIGVVAGLGLYIGLRRFFFRKRPGHCAECGYNLTGNVGGICPECGTTVTRAGGEGFRGGPFESSSAKSLKASPSHNHSWSLASRPQDLGESGLQSAINALP